MTLKFLSMTGVVVMSLATLAGCATYNKTGTNYSSGEARQEMMVRWGVVEGLRDVTIDEKPSSVGALAGGVLGGITGSAVGGGRGAQLATVAGVVAGGLLGNQIEQRVDTRPGVEILVKLASGTTVAIIQDIDPKEHFHVGERVRINTARGVSRVTH